MQVASHRDIVYTCASVCVGGGLDQLLVPLI